MGVIVDHQQAIGAGKPPGGEREQAGKAALGPSHRDEAGPVRRRKMTRGREQKAWREKGVGFERPGGEARPFGPGSLSMRASCRSSGGWESSQPSSRKS